MVTLRQYVERKKEGFKNWLLNQPGVLDSGFSAKGWHGYKDGTDMAREMCDRIINNLEELLAAADLSPEVDEYRQKINTLQHNMLEALKVAYFMRTGRELKY